MMYQLSNDEINRLWNPYVHEWNNRICNPVEIRNRIWYNEFKQKFKLEYGETTNSSGSRQCILYGDQKYITLFLLQL